MNRISLPHAVRRALLGLAASTASAMIAPAIAQDSAEADAMAGAEAEAAPPVAMEDVMVVGRQRAAADEILQERIDAEVVADLVSIEQISRVGDSTVSLALRRLPGVTLVGDQFIYIRGLGERYSSTSVNGAYVPSPDLTRNVMPMDLFPAEIVESISIQKGYSADQPAAFGGGNVDIRTRSLPDEFVFNFQVGTGTNSGSSDNGLTYAGGSDDDLGTDDGTRALPQEISAAIQEYRGDLSQTGIYNTLLLDGEFHSFEEAQQINRQLATSLYRDVDFTKASMDPDLSLEISIGNSWYVGDAEQWKIGMLALGDYNNTWRNKERTLRSATTPDEDFDVTNRTTNQVVLTGSLGVGIDFADEHRVEATGIYLRNTEDETSLTLGHNFNFRLESGQQLRNYDIRYEERELELVQFHGTHRLGPATIELSKPFVDRVRRWPDVRLVLVGLDGDDGNTERDPVLGGRYDQSRYRRADLDLDPFFAERGRLPLHGSRGHGDQLRHEALDAVHLRQLEVEFTGGYDYYDKGRSYLQTQLGMGTTSGGAVLIGTPGQVFTDANILDPANEFGLTIGGIGTESYLAGETVDSFWGQGRLHVQRHVARDRRPALGGLRAPGRADQSRSSSTSTSASSRCPRTSWRSSPRPTTTTTRRSRSPG